MPFGPQAAVFVAFAQREVVADRDGDLRRLRPRQFILRQHDHEPKRPAADIFGRPDNVLVGGGLELLFMERRRVE